MSSFDLDKFAPAPIRFTYRGVPRSVFGDPDTDQVARMLRIETQLEEADGIEETLAVVQEGCDLLNEMVHDFDPGQEPVKLGARALLTVYALILHGSSVAAAVAEAICQPDKAAGDDREAVTTAGDGTDDGERDADAAPLASASLSSEPSSPSAEHTAGLLATGSG